LYVLGWKRRTAVAVSQWSNHCSTVIVRPAGQADAGVALLLELADPADDVGTLDGGNVPSAALGSRSRSGGHPAPGYRLGRR
jgi:hypothetical protein